MSFPDLELGLVDLFASLVPAGYTGTDTPADLEQRLPYVRVNRIGGRDDGVTDSGSYDVDFFAASRASAVALADQGDDLLRDARTAGDFLIDNVRTDVGLRRLPWPNPKVRRRSATYTVSARRLPTP